LERRVHRFDRREQRNTVATPMRHQNIASPSSFDNVSTPAASRTIVSSRSR
jgi:hypothetical protein